MMPEPAPPVTGWRCAVCGSTTGIEVAMSWKCGHAGDGGHHAPRIEQQIAPLRSNGDHNPFIAFRRYLAWDGFAAAHGLDAEERTRLVRDLDAQVATVAGTGFVSTPFGRADRLSEELGFTADGGVWVKDETHNVAGSHKARHLFSILLHLRTLEYLSLAPWSTAAHRPRLAIASCGNAAIAASTLAASAQWPIDVFVPTTASAAVKAMLHTLGANVVECPRRDDDPPGDPCVHRFREAVANGAVPFSVQGTENAWCLDGGRTIGWEMARHMEEVEIGPPIDRLYVQVGGGAFASSVAAGFRMSGITPRLHAVQTEACAPLARAWERAGGAAGARAAAQRWDECMWPWEQVGTSAADGILDDETYDWLPLVEAMADGHGEPVVVDETHVVAAVELGRRATGVHVSATGAAGLAGLLATRGAVRDDERIAVILSGIQR